MDGGGIASTPFVRELASSDRKTRDRAVDSLTKYLRSRRDLSLLEMLKIWKGLFFCFYHSDGPITQQSLARSLSYGLLPNIPEESLQNFLRAFWITMGRDWQNLDRLRLDKYMYLIRCYVGVAFEVFVGRGLQKRAAASGKVVPETTTGSKAAQKGGKKGKKAAAKEKEAEAAKKRKRAETDDNDDEASETGKRKRVDGSIDTEDADVEAGYWVDLEKYIAMLEEGVLAPENIDPRPVTDYDLTPEGQAVKMPKGPDGLRYHLMDLWVDELEKMVAEEKDEGGMDEGEPTGGSRLKEGVPAQLLLRPIVGLKERGITRFVRRRAGETLADARLIRWGVVKAEDEDEEDEDDEELEEAGENEDWSGFD